MLNKACTFLLVTKWFPSLSKKDPNNCNFKLPNLQFHFLYSLLLILCTFNSFLFKKSSCSQITKTSKYIVSTIQFKKPSNSWYIKYENMHVKLVRKVFSCRKLLMFHLIVQSCSPEGLSQTRIFIRNSCQIGIKDWRFYFS